MYREQGVSIHNKHIELIVRQMLKKVLVAEAGDGKFLPGERVDGRKFAEENRHLVTTGARPAEGRPELMGITKALQERIVLKGNLSRLNQGTRFCCVRYGNVLRSRGSVVPFFRRQLALGQTMTITDERMTRFLLTLNEAIDLVLYAAEHTAGGEIFVRKAAAAKVTDIACVMAAEVGLPCDYKVIGILPGEKLHEILVSEEELVRVRDCGEYYTIHPWWGATRHAELEHEFGSSEHVTDVTEIKRMIALADREFETLEMSDGEFAKF